MWRHILVFELVAEASRSGEECVSDQLNKTWVKVNLNVSWWTLRQPDGLWHRWSDQMKNRMKNYTFPFSMTPHSPGYTYTSFSIKALTCSLHPLSMPSWNNAIWSEVTEHTLLRWCARWSITWNEPLTATKVPVYSHINWDTYPFTDHFNEVVIPCNALLYILVQFIPPNEQLHCIQKYLSFIRCGSVQFRPGVFGNQSLLDDLDSIMTDHMKIKILDTKRTMVVHACMCGPLLLWGIVVLLIALNVDRVGSRVATGAWCLISGVRGDDGGVLDMRVSLCGQWNW